MAVGDDPLAQRGLADLLTPALRETQEEQLLAAEAGGGNDVQARLIAQGLTGALGEQVIVENRPSGIIPGDIVSKAQPNGYTLLLYNNALWTGPLGADSDGAPTPPPAFRMATI